MESFLLFVRFLLIVVLFLREVFLELLHILIALGGRRENAGDLEGVECRIGSLFLLLNFSEELVEGDGVIDGSGGEHGIEFPLGGALIVLIEDGLDDGALGEGFAGLRKWGVLVGLRLVVIDVELEHVLVLNGVGDCIFVQLLLEDVLGGLVGGDVAIDLASGGVFLKDGSAGEAEELGVGEEVFDGAVVFPELGAVTLIKDDGDAFLRDGGELLLVVILIRAIEREAELLDGGDDDFIGIVI